MIMAENQTQKNNGSVAEFIASAEPSARREDLQQVVDMMHKITGLEPDMWGDSIIGFGSYAYRYESGRAAEWFLVGCSPRKQALTLYLMAGHERFPDLMRRLGKYKTGKACLYINKLADVNRDVLHELIAAAYHYMNDKYNNKA